MRRGMRVIWGTCLPTLPVASPPQLEDCAQVRLLSPCRGLEMTEEGETSRWLRGLCHASWLVGVERGVAGRRGRS